MPMLNRLECRVLVFIRAQLTNAHSEAANLMAKNLNWIGRDYRNHDHYRLRILLYTVILRPAERPVPRLPCRIGARLRGLPVNMTNAR